MRTTITVDDGLFDKACDAAGDKNASSVVTRALKLLVASDSKKRILRLSGSMPDFTVPNRGDGGELDYRALLHDDPDTPMVADEPKD